MKKTLLALPLILTCTVASAYFESGNRLAQSCFSEKFVDKGYCIGYIAGVWDALSGVVLCGSNEVTSGQVEKIVKKYLSENPESLHLPADRLIVRALLPTFGCKR
jgi:hypothetical protein